MEDRNKVNGTMGLMMLSPVGASLLRMRLLVADASEALQYVFGPVLFLVSLFLILLVLVQRGRGGGLAGALGGMGGQSAFGSKAGDIFTRITVVVATIWILLCCLAIACLNRQESVPPPAQPTLKTGDGAGGGESEPADKKGSSDQEAAQKSGAPNDDKKADSNSGSDEKASNALKGSSSRTTSGGDGSDAEPAGGSPPNGKAADTKKSADS